MMAKRGLAEFLGIQLHLNFCGVGSLRRFFKNAPCTDFASISVFLEIDAKSVSAGQVQI